MGSDNNKYITSFVDVGTSGADRAEESVIRGLLESGFRNLRFPPQLETLFRRNASERAARLLRASVFGLIAIYLMVVVPISLFSTEQGLRFWQASVLVPIGVVLTIILLATRLRSLDRYVESLLVFSLIVSMGGSLFCSMTLGDTLLGHITAFQTIYILVIAFSILRIPTVMACMTAVAAFVFALIAVQFQQVEIPWLMLLLSWLVPLLLCAVTGYLLEHGDRQAFLQNRLITLEAGRLEDMRQEAEQNLARQQRHAAFLQLIAGNPDHTTLFNRVVGFLVEQTGSFIAAGYLVEPSVLRCICTWGGDPARHGIAETLEPEEGLIGAALVQKRVCTLSDLPSEYLPIISASGQGAASAVMIVPVVHDGEPVAVLELGRFEPYTEEHRQLAESICTSFAFAIFAARSRHT